MLVQVRLAAVQHCMTCMADLYLTYIASDRAVVVICMQHSAAVKPVTAAKNGSAANAVNNVVTGL